MEPGTLAERVSIIEKEWGQTAFAQRFARFLSTSSGDRIESRR
jgi:hypothetical protein